MEQVANLRARRLLYTAVACFAALIVLASLALAFFYWYEANLARDVPAAEIDRLTKVNSALVTAVSALTTERNELVRTSALVKKAWESERLELKKALDAEHQERSRVAGDTYQLRREVSRLQDRASEIEARNSRLQADATKVWSGWCLENKVQAATSFELQIDDAAWTSFSLAPRERKTYYVQGKEVKIRFRSATLGKEGAVKVFRLNVINRVGKPPNESELKACPLHCFNPQADGILTLNACGVGQ